MSSDKQPDAGLAVKDFYRQTGISSATSHKWKSKYGGTDASELTRVKELGAENNKLKRMYVKLALAIAAMKDWIASLHDWTSPKFKTARNSTLKLST